jgi:diguanylate cyclase (GGDEF)-like protein
LKIGEIAKLNQVTTKLLRYYDEIGLLKPVKIDPETGYRTYAPEQSHLLNWIIVLKSLDFSLNEVKELLSGPLDREMVIRQLVRKRIEIASALNEQIQKKIAIDRLITIIEKEGFHMSKKIDLQQIAFEDVQEIKKNIPNMEMFLETASDIFALGSENDQLSIFRFDISHFKQVNDDYGFEVGDKVIVSCYKLIEANVGKHLRHATVGRSFGDEFIVFALADKHQAALAAQSIIEDMKHFDFPSIGCPKSLGCYIGGLVSPVRPNTDIRAVVEASVEVIERAQLHGPNTCMIEPYHA